MENNQRIGSYNYLIVPEKHGTKDIALQIDTSGYSNFIDKYNIIAYQNQNKTGQLFSKEFPSSSKIFEYGTFFKENYEKVDYYATGKGYSFADGGYIKIKGAQASGSTYDYSTVTFTLDFTNVYGIVVHYYDCWWNDSHDKEHNGIAQLVRADIDDTIVQPSHKVNKGATECYLVPYPLSGSHTFIIELIGMYNNPSGVYIDRIELLRNKEQISLDSASFSQAQKGKTIYWAQQINGGAISETAVLGRRKKVVTLSTSANQTHLITPANSAGHGIRIPFSATYDSRYGSYSNTLHFYYNIDNGAWTSIPLGVSSVSGESLSLAYEINYDLFRKGNSLLSSGNHTVNFKLSDGIDAAYSKVTVNLVHLTHDKTSFKPTYYNKGEAKKLVSDLKFTFDSQYAEKITLFINYKGTTSNTTLSKDKYQISGSNGQILISKIEIGKFFKIGIQLGIGDFLTSVKWSEYYARPLLPQTPTNLAFLPQRNFENQLQASFTLPSLTQFHLEIISSIFGIKRNSGAEITATAVQSSGSNYQAILKDTSQILYGEKVTPFVRFQDSGGQRVEKTFPQIDKLSKIFFGGQQIELNSDRIYSLRQDSDQINESLIIKTPHAWVNQDKNQLPNSKIYLSYADASGGISETRALVKTTFLKEPESSPYWGSFLAKWTDVLEAQKQIIDRTLLDKNTNYIFKVIFQNSYVLPTNEEIFGELSTNINVLYQEAPVFLADNSSIKAYHDYDVSTTQISQMSEIDITKEILNLSSDPSSIDFDIRNINPLEGIILKIPVGFDLNDQNYQNGSDIKEYHAYIGQKDFLGDTDFFMDDKNDTFFFRKQPDFIIKRNNYSISNTDGTSNGFISQDGFIYYYYKIPKEYSEKLICFKFQLKDSKGLLSNFSEKSPTIIVGRTDIPVFDITNLQATQKEGELEVIFNMNYIDMGSNKIGNFWNSSSYNKYPNYDRTFSINGNSQKIQYVPKIEIFIQASADVNFTDSKENILTWQPQQEQTLGDFSLTRQSVIFPGITSTANKFFFKFQVFITYGIDTSFQDPNKQVLNGYAYTTSQEKQIPYYGQVPTVSLRAQKVGINTNVFEQGEVLTLEGNPELNLIKLRGISKNGDLISNHDILFNLANGQLDGIIINGGTWD